MITIFYLLLSVCMALGLIQASFEDQTLPDADASPRPQPSPIGASTPPAEGSPAETLGNAGSGANSDNTNRPPSAGNPNNPNTTTNSQQGGDTDKANAMAAFNRQMFILDKYIFQPQMFTGQKVTDASTPLNVPTENINEMLSARGDAMNNWINGISPKEYAQMVPKIRLSLVNIEDQSQVDIPLSEASSIHAGLASPQYFTNKTVGLKSLEMNIDGNTTPVTGKIYNVSLTLVFDSVNTFFGTIPGLNISYADALRRQGTVGGDAYKHKMKLSIAHSAPPTALADDGQTSLTEKYDLDGKLTFVAYLTLIKTNLALKENLQAEVKVDFQGYEEGLLKNELLFDFLRVDLSAAAADRTAAIATARNARDAALNSENEKFEEAQREANNAADSLVRELTERLSATAMARDHFTRQGEAGQRGRAVMNAMMEAGIITERQRDLVWGTDWEGDTYQKEYMRLMQSTDPNNPGRSALERYVREVLIPKTMAMEGGYNFNEPDGYNRIAGEGTGTVYDFKDLVESLIGAGSPMEALKRANGDLQRAKDKANTQLGDKEREIEAKYQHARISQIRKALNELLFSKTEAFHHVEVGSAEMNEYISNIRLGTQLNYFQNPSNGLGSGNRGAGASRSGAGSDQETLENPTVPADAGAGEAGSGTTQSGQNIENLTRAREASRANLDAAKLVVEQMRRQLEEGVWDDVPNTGGRGFIQTALEQAEAEVEKYEKEIAEVNQALQTTNQRIRTIGSKPDLEKRLTDFEEITYIYFGDLVALVMTHLKNTSRSSPRAKMHFERIRFLLTNIVLPGGTGMSTRRKLYNMPIDLAQLQKIFADRLYGTQKSTFTLLELVREVIRVITLSQQRKARLLQKSNAAATFALNVVPYPLQANGNLAASPNQEPILHGMIVRVRDTIQTINGANGTYASNVERKIPHFFLGGASSGAVRAIEVAEMEDDDIAKVTFARLTGGSDVATGVLPAIFTAKVKMHGCPFLHMGMYFYLGAPTINSTPSQGWFFLEGYYSIKSLSHSYSASGQYVTEIEGIIQIPKQQAIASEKIVELASSTAAAVRGATAAASDAISSGVSSLTKRSLR